jgi:replicative superfamily II helicase
VAFEEFPPAAWRSFRFHRDIVRKDACSYVCRSSAFAVRRGFDCTDLRKKVRDESSCHHAGFRRTSAFSFRSQMPETNSRLGIEKGVRSNHTRTHIAIGTANGGTSRVRSRKWLKQQICLLRSSCRSRENSAKHIHFFDVSSCSGRRGIAAR